MALKKKADIDRRIFDPESVAVIGATSNVMKFGNMYMRALLEFGFKGRICHRLCLVSARKSTNRKAPGPISPTPKEEERDVRWRRIPLVRLFISLPPS